MCDHDLSELPVGAIILLGNYHKFVKWVVQLHQSWSLVMVSL